MIVNIEIYPTEFLVDISALPTVFNVEISQGGGGGGTTVTKTSDLTNDGEDGVNAFITEKDIPAPIDISSKADKTAGNLSAGNILSWQEALQINYLQNALADEITARENADIAEANARAFADGILQGKIDLKLDRPTGGTDGDVLVKSGTSALWSSIIKGVEFLGNAWLKLKLISFQGYTIAQKNAIASPTEGMLIYQNESPKGFQKYEGGVWSVIESNISNADLSNVSVRTFTQGNSFTWNTSGFGYFWKGLPNKTGNSDYNKVIVEHNTTGEVATKSIDIVSYTDLSAVFSGTIIPLNKLSGAYQMTVRNYTVYTTSNLVVGGWAVIRINTTSEPTISGATKITGFEWVSGYTLYMYVRYNGSFVEYYFSI